MRFFLLVSLLLHLAVIAFLSRVPLRIPGKIETGPLQVRLVSVAGKAVQGPSGEKNEKPPIHGEEITQDAPKKAINPKKVREKPETALREARENAVTEQSGNESRKIPKRNDPAETRKSWETEKGSTLEGTAEANAAAEPRKNPAKSVAGKNTNSTNGLPKEAREDERISGSARSVEEERKTGGAAVQNGVGSESRAPADLAVIPEDLILEKVVPVYPLTARRRGQQGRVLLRVLLSTSGTVEKIFVEESSGFDVLDEAALRAVGRWLFSPKAPPAVLVPIRFRLQ